MYGNVETKGLLLKIEISFSYIYIYNIFKI